MVVSKKPDESTWSLTDSLNADFDNYARVGDLRKFDAATASYPRENDAFIYPGPYVRNIAGPSTKVRRGFMRSILMGGDIAGILNPNGKNPGNLRLNFQFNPEYIERRVSQSPGAVNPLLQAPANLTQAVPGTAQFNFSMMFNREAEVARGESLRLGKFETSIIQNGKSSIQVPTIDITPASIDAAYGDPSLVGVMHDLAIFDKIIGQGISEELIDVLSSYTNRQIEEQNETIVAANAAALKLDPTAIAKPTQNALPSDFKVTLNKNFGNSAFLNPMPIRIVFSDLFMVEGLVVGSAVAFQKFSQDMIPTICQVNCEVYALYVGFAQKNAFLTDNLTSWAQSTAQATTAAANAVTAEAAKFKNSLIDGEVYINYGPNAGYSEGLVTPLFPDSLQTNNAYRKLGLFDAKQKVAYRLGNTFYSGASGNLTVNYVTLPQWYNTFADGGGFVSLCTLNNGGYVGNTIREQYKNFDYPTAKNNISLSHPYGFLPITIKVKTTYKDLQLNTKSKLIVQILSKPAGTSVSTKISLPEATGSGWVFESSQSPGTGLVKEYTYSNTFYISPNQVKANKEFLPAGNSYNLNLTLKFDVVPPNQQTGVSTVTHTFTVSLLNNDGALFYNSFGSSNVPRKFQFRVQKPGA